MTELEKLQKYLDNYIDLIADRVSHYGYSIDQMKNIFGPYEKYMSDDLLKKYEDKLDFLEKEKLEKRNNFVDYKPRGAVKKFSGIHKLRRMKVELAAAGAVSLAVVGCSLNKNENYKYEESAEIQTERSYETNLEPETDAVVHTDLTAEQIKSTYANIIYNGRDNIAQALQNGIKISPEQYVHNYLIANIDHLTENEKLLMTSSDLIEINDLFDLSSQLSVVMMNTVNDNIPFNAYTLFTDNEVAERLNEGIRLFANYNENKTNENKNAFQEYARNYINNIETYIQENNSAVEFTLRLFDAAAQPGIELLTEDEVIDFAAILENDGCMLERNRIALGEKLEIDPMLIRRESYNLDEKLANARQILNSKLNLDENKIDQILFATNMSDLSEDQINMFANTLELEGISNNYLQLCNIFSQAIIDGKVNTSNFNFSSIFFNNEEDAENMNELVSIVERYRTSDESIKEQIAEEYQKFAFDYSMDVSDRLVKNPAASTMILNLISTIENSEMGLHLSEDLKTILVDDGSLRGCVSINYTHIDEDNNIVSERTFYEQAVDKTVETLKKYAIGYGNVSRDFGNSIYGKIVYEYGATVREELLNRYDVTVAEIRDLTKDYVFVERDAFDYDVVNYDTVSYTSLPGETVVSETIEDVPVSNNDGKGSADNSDLPIWTDEQIKEEESKVHETENQTEQYQVAVSKEDESEYGKKIETVKGIVEGEEDKGEQEVNGIVVEETKETEISTETMITTDENGNEIDYDDTHYIIDEYGNVWDLNGNLIIQGEDVPNVEESTETITSQETESNKSEEVETSKQEQAETSKQEETKKSEEIETNKQDDSEELGETQTEIERNDDVIEVASNYVSYENGYWMYTNSEGETIYVNDEGILIDKSEFVEKTTGVKIVDTSTIVDEFVSESEFTETEAVETEAKESETEKVETEAKESETEKVETEAKESETEKAETEAKESETEKVETEVKESETEKVETEAKESETEKVETEAKESETEKVETEVKESETEKVETEVKESDIEFVQYENGYFKVTDENGVTTYFNDEGEAINESLFNDNVQYIQVTIGSLDDAVIQTENEDSVNYEDVSVESFTQVSTESDSLSSSLTSVNNNVVAQELMDDMMSFEEAAAESEAQAKAESEAQAKAESEAQAKAESEAQAKAESEAQAKAESEAQAKAETAAPETVAETTAPETVAETAAPETVAETTAPETVAETTAPETVAETAAPETVAETTAPETVAETTAPETEMTSARANQIAELKDMKSALENIKLDEKVFTL